MSGELLLIIVVALVVFGPNKLPTVAAHLAQCMRYYHQRKADLTRAWHSHYQAACLQVNEDRAKEADAAYQLASEGDRMQTHASHLLQAPNTHHTH